MNPITLVPLSSCLQVSRRHGGPICVECSLCRMLFVFEASAFKPDEDIVCFHCALERKPTRGVQYEEVEEESVSEVRKKSSSNKQVKFKIGGHVYYPGCSELPKKETKIFSCQSCSSSVRVIRSGAVKASRKPKVYKALFCKDCCAKSSGYYSRLKRILGYSVDNILSPLFWLLLKCFEALYGMAV